MQHVVISVRLANCLIGPRRLYGGRRFLIVQVVHSSLTLVYVRGTNHPLLYPMSAGLIDAELDLSNGNVTFSSILQHFSLIYRADVWNSDVNRKPKIWYTKKKTIPNRYLVFLSQISWYFLGILSVF